MLLAATHALLAKPFQGCRMGFPHQRRISGIPASHLPRGPAQAPRRARSPKGIAT
jgi:hypothetical protein